MDLRLIQAAILERGIAVRALDEVVARVTTRFGDTQPRPADLTTFLDGLDPWTKLGMDKGTFDKLPPDDRMTLARSFLPPVPLRPRRPTTRPLSPEELTALDAEGLGWAERREKARVLQQTPLPEP